MDLASFRLLLTADGQAALEFARQLEPREVDYLRHFQRLEKRFPRALAQAALETAILRIEARSKYPHSDLMYFTREALEQASPHHVSAYRSERFHPCERLVDLGCSIGSDTFNLARVAPTTGIDIDPLRLAMAQANALALDYAGQVQFVRADLKANLPVKGTERLGLFFDPARRIGDRRAFSIWDYTPPLKIVKDWLPITRALGVKISPGVKVAEIASYDAELEFISLKGKLKEAVLWFGPLNTAKRRATILPGPHTLVGEDSQEPLPLGEPLEYLYEPDPAIIRAGLVADLGGQLGASQIDPDIAYLSAEQIAHSPFARVWKVENWFPFGLKRLREYLRERKVGQITVKKRGSPLQPEELIRMLRLSGDEQRVVFLTHLIGAPIMIVCFSNHSVA
jgi:SAM-dependent methyltransferase